MTELESVSARQSELMMSWRNYRREVQMVQTTISCCLIKIQNNGWIGRKL